MKNGILPVQQIRDEITAGHIISSMPVTEAQLQPASMDLRLGTRGSTGICQRHFCLKAKFRTRLLEARTRSKRLWLKWKNATPNFLTSPPPPNNLLIWSLSAV